MSHFRFVSDYADTYGVKRLCRVLHVSRSGYYDWRCRKPSARSVRNTELTTLITEIHRRSRTTYGAPRVHAELRRLGEVCAKKRVARLMAEEGLVGAHARRKWRTGKPDVAPAPDLVRRNFGPPRADRVWGADVTQFRTDEGWLHFAGVVDLYSRRVVGWAMRPTPPWRSATELPSSGSPVRSDPRATASTIRWSRPCGPRSSGNWPGSTGDARGRRGTCCVRPVPERTAHPVTCRRSG